LNPRRTRSLALLALVCTQPAFAAQGAETYPQRPIRWIMPYPVGGSIDTVSRAVAQRLGERFGQQVIVDNRTGAGGTIGTEMAARAPADGYTLVNGGDGTLAVSPTLRPGLRYDPLKDFDPITVLVFVTYVMVVHPSVPVKGVGDLVALAKSKPGQLNYASGGAGSAPHMIGELFNARTRAQMVHIAYKGSSPAINDLLAGQVQMMFTGLPSILQQVKAGRVRALAVTSKARVAAMPDLPTFLEAGVEGLDVSPWFGVLAPAGTPRQLLTRLHSEFVTILQSQGMRDFLVLQGVEAGGMPPEAFAAFIRKETAQWREIIRSARIKAD
jgi:tripartite-type tricarboxylate transporter receptor subunit TctC